MAQKHIVQLIDDIDESKAEETVQFAIDGSAYEIDLNAKHASQLRDALAPFVAHARRGGRSASASYSGAAGRRAARTDRAQTQAIRDWAKKNGYKVGEKGRIPASVVEAYNNS